ncbi:helix-turn-helix domain-containing protein [Enterovibrio baiacu]|uniref:helix-turn-helix domain-containing protein n=1 Tax=Enterovibrio baiacu TaxID=2491023 RepID=UPI003D0A6FC6
MTWLDELRKQVDATSLSSVANAMGVSKAMISQVLNGKYKGNMQRVQSLVESVYMGHTVVCPVLGEIPKHKCLAHQNAKHVGSTPNAIRLWKACRSECPNSQLEERLTTPIRLSIESKNTLQQPGRVCHQPNAEQTKVRQYDAAAVCSRLERQAKTDSESMAGSYHRLYIELLKRELMAVGNRYNRLIKQ